MRRPARLPLLAWIQCRSGSCFASAALHSLFLVLHWACIIRFCTNIIINFDFFLLSPSCNLNYYAPASFITVTIVSTIMICLLSFIVLTYSFYFLNLIVYIRSIFCLSCWYLWYLKNWCYRLYSVYIAQKTRETPFRPSPFLVFSKHCCSSSPVRW